MRCSCKAEPQQKQCDEPFFLHTVFVEVPLSVAFRLKASLNCRPHDRTASGESWCGRRRSGWQRSSCRSALADPHRAILNRGRSLTQDL